MPLGVSNGDKAPERCNVDKSGMDDGMAKITIKQCLSLCRGKAETQHETPAEGVIAGQGEPVGCGGNHREDNGYDITRVIERYCRVAGLKCLGLRGVEMGSIWIEGFGNNIVPVRRGCRLRV
jgi:hypothetical protein